MSALAISRLPAPPFLAHATLRNAPNTRMSATKAAAAACKAFFNRTPTALPEKAADWGYGQQFETSARETSKSGGYQGSGRLESPLRASNAAAFLSMTSERRISEGSNQTGERAGAVLPVIDDGTTSVVAVKALRCSLAALVPLLAESPAASL
jgi:hypothetical protein